tara:strand:+ start:1511 stop:1687 length:177 start_codon:yes stop_codon:yes gene_type:complete
MERFIPFNPVLTMAEKLAQRLPQYKVLWKASMTDQIQDLPDFGKVEREVMRHLRNLEL